MNMMENEWLPMKMKQLMLQMRRRQVSSTRQVQSACTNG